MKGSLGHPDAPASDDFSDLVHAPNYFVTQNQRFLNFKGVIAIMLFIVQIKPQIPSYTISSATASGAIRDSGSCAVRRKLSPCTTTASTATTRLPICSADTQYRDLVAGHWLALLQHRELTAARHALPITGNTTG